MNPDRKPAACHSFKVMVDAFRLLRQMSAGCEELPVMVQIMNGDLKATVR